MRRNLYADLYRLEESHWWHKAKRALCIKYIYTFAKLLQKKRISIAFASNAIVYWLPRRNLTSAFIMFMRFAYGDAEAGIVRGKVVLVFMRYIFLAVVSIFIPYSGLLPLGLISAYVSWAILKNYRYVNDVKAAFYLPMLQFTADLAVIIGSSFGFFRYLRRFSPNFL